jgi:surface-anchored protein
MKILSFQKFLLATTIFLSVPLAARAQSLLSEGTGRLSLAYSAVHSEFLTSWDVESGAIVDGSPLGSSTNFALNELSPFVSLTVNSPNGLSNVIGVSDGTPIYSAGISPFSPALLFSTASLNPVDWLGDITLTLTSWDVPGGGNFALYTTNLANTSAVDSIFSTFNSTSTFSSNSFGLTPGDSVGARWGFSSPGIYTLNFEFTGTHVLDGFISSSETVLVNVAIPEPSNSAVLLGIAALYMTLGRPRRRASQ